MTKQEKAAVQERVTCSWKTGVNTCNVMPTAGKYCAWHQYWVRLVEAGNLGRTQEEEFREWWEQFQPWGRYANTPGLWWADVAVLWQALTGVGEVPYTTDAIHAELFLRRAEVRMHLIGQDFMHQTTSRLSGPPLPEWIAEVWQAKVNGSFPNAKQRG